jgi:hypothetical protein
MPAARRVTDVAPCYFGLLADARSIAIGRAKKVGALKAHG